MCVCGDIEMNDIAGISEICVGCVGHELVWRNSGVYIVSRADGVFIYLV